MFARADVDAVYESGQTLLMSAAVYGSLRAVGLILGSDVDIDKQNHQGQRALMQAASKGHLDVVQTLLERGADPNLLEKNSYNALTLAFMEEKYDTFLLLLMHTDLHQMTPLAETMIHAVIEKLQQDLPIMTVSTASAIRKILNYLTHPYLENQVIAKTIFS